MRKALIAAVFAGAILFSCNKPPKPCIEVSDDVAAVGTPVTFTSCSKRALSYEWFITGPAGAPENTKGWSEIQFVNTFTVPGTYTIELTAYKKFSWLGESATATETLVIN
jgi:hypothetical protein